MIDANRMEQIKKAMISGASHRRIAQRFGVNVKTVSRIAAQVHSELDEETKFEMQRRKQARRCPGCGWLIYTWPCLNCQLQRTAVRSEASGGRSTVPRRTRKAVRKSA